MILAPFLGTAANVWNSSNNHLEEWSAKLGFKQSSFGVWNRIQGQLVEATSRK